MRERLTGSNRHPDFAGAQSRVHRYEAAGIGRKEFKIKHLL
jgi:hypothetical protein